MSWLFPSVRWTRLPHLPSTATLLSRKTAHSSAQTSPPGERACGKTLRQMSFTLLRELQKDALVLEQRKAGVWPPVFCSLFFFPSWGPVPSSLPSTRRHPAQRHSIDGGKYSSPTHRLCNAGFTHFTYTSKKVSFPCFHLLSYHCFSSRITMEGVLQEPRQ